MQGRSYNCWPKLFSDEASSCNDDCAPPPADEAADWVCSDRLINRDEISLPSGELLCNACFSSLSVLDTGLSEPSVVIQLSITDAPSVGETLDGLPLRACTVWSINADAPWFWEVITWVVLVIVTKVKDDVRPNCFIKFLLCHG